MTNSLIIPCHQQGTNIKSIAPLDATGKQQLAEIGIDYAVIPSQTKSVHLLILNRIYNGIALENKNGGLEFYSHQLISDLSSLYVSFKNNSAERQQQSFLRSVKTMRRATRKAYKESLKKGSVPGEEVSLEEEFSSPVPQTITFNEPGIIFFPYQRGTKTTACCVFSSLIDYLSYSTLIKKGNTFGLPVKYDCIIVNNVRNFPDALLDCEEYQRIYCILPNTDVGRVMAYTIQHRNKGRYVDVSKIYNGYEDLHDFMTNQKIQDIYE